VCDFLPLQDLRIETPISPPKIFSEFFPPGFFGVGEAIIPASLISNGGGMSAAVPRMPGATSSFRRAFD
jgi:hypothetical protein